MRASLRTIAAGGLLLLLGDGPPECLAQAVGFAPIPGVIPDGVSLTATPAVSHDRRYVRLSVNPTFSTVTGFQSFPVPAAVGGGGGGAGGAGGLVGFGTMGGAVDGVGPGPGPSAADWAQRPGSGSGAGPSSFASSFAQFLDAPPDRPASPRRAPAKRAPAPAARRKTTRR